MTIAQGDDQDRVEPRELIRFVLRRRAFQVSETILVAWRAAARLVRDSALPPAGVSGDLSLC